MDGEIESLPKDFVPIVLYEKDEVGKEKVREVYLGQKVLPHAVTEPNADDDITGEREAYMASVLQIYESSLHFCINNCGNPFTETIYGIHSRQFEMGVLDWFARLWGIAKEEYWGYVTTSGTEGNFHGILVGRELFPDGILYTSDDSHNSIFRAAQMYRMNFTDTLETTGFTEDRFYIHVDGALIGLMMPSVKRAPKISFEKPIGSVCISGHKFLGCPMPCGVHITRLDHIEALSRNIEYIGFQDATLMGSRSEVHMCLKNAQYLYDCLHASGISAMINEFSNIVAFEKPQNEEFVRYWQLAVQGNLAHIVVMPNITIAQLDDYLRDLSEKRAIWLREGKLQPLCVTANVGTENCACP
ncbi:hypothetical protein MKX01_004892 [Papaver californicum]|nr:hypothetical protein MKX01_004892 [Papaver californicum]